MDALAWAQVAAICAMGAMSPGPSLAVVLRNTMVGGKGAGVATGAGHGLGILIYAGAVVTGLAVLLHALPGLETAIAAAGIALLVWLGLGFLGIRFGRAGGGAATEAVSGRGGFAAGFLIAFLNPKIAAFFLAVFAPFIRLDATAAEKAGMAALAGTIDTAWYVLVALVLSGTGLTTWLRGHGRLVDRGMGALLLVVAAGLVARLV